MPENTKDDPLLHANNRDKNPWLDPRVVFKYGKFDARKIHRQHALGTRRGHKRPDHHNVTSSMWGGKRYCSGEITWRGKQLKRYAEYEIADVLADPEELMEKNAPPLPRNYLAKAVRHQEQPDLPRPHNSAPALTAPEKKTVRRNNAEKYFGRR